MEWWESAYPGGPMVTVAGFPRSVYPPDAATLPSEPGVDVLAYKRVVSRAGRWPWATFDDVYSNAFSHGKSGGNVGDSGVAGIQRQGGITPASGVIGVATFNLLRSIRIPAGLPHAGEPAMDATAVALVNQAYALFNPPPPPPAPPWTADAQSAAKKLLTFHTTGLYRADNPGDLADIEATAKGKPVWSRAGVWVYLDRHPLDILVWLIAVHGYKIGTFALCSDHSNDGPHGHAGGKAVDISSINDVSLATGGHDLALDVARLLHTAPADLTPRQLICGGAGNRPYADIQAQCIPSAAYYGAATIAEHENHIHCGY